MEIDIQEGGQPAIPRIADCDKIQKDAVEYRRKIESRERSLQVALQIDGSNLSVETLLENSELIYLWLTADLNNPESFLQYTIKGLKQVSA